MIQTFLNPRNTSNPVKYFLQNYSPSNIEFHQKKQTISLSPGGQHELMNLDSFQISVDGHQFKINPLNTHFPIFFAPPLHLASTCENTIHSYVITSVLTFINHTRFPLFLRADSSHFRFWNAELVPEVTVSVPSSDIENFFLSPVSDFHKAESIDFAQLRRKPKMIFIPMGPALEAFICEYSVDSSTAVSTISIVPRFLIKSNLIHQKIALFYDRSALKLAPDQTKPLCGLSPHHSYRFPARAQFAEMKSEPATVTLESDSLTGFSFGNLIWIAAFAQQVRNQIVLQLFTPVILNNQTSQTLLISDSHATAAVSAMETGYLGSSSFFSQNRQIAFCISIAKDTKVSDPIDLHKSPATGFVFLKAIAETGPAVPLQYRIKRPIDHCQSLVFTISAGFRVRNLLPINLWIRLPHSVKGRRFLPNSEADLLQANESATFCLGFSKTKCTLSLSFHSTFHQTFRVPSSSRFIEIDTQQHGTGFIIIVKPAILPQPLMVSNFTTLSTLGFSQTRDSDVTFVSRFSTTFLAFHELINKSSLFLRFHKKFAEISIEQQLHNHQIALAGRKLYIDVAQLANNCELIIIREEPVVHDGLPEFHISFGIPELSISLIDDDLYELALLTIRTISLDLDQVSEMTVFTFSVNAIQLDDMYPNVPIPMVLCCSAHFLKFRVFLTSSCFANIQTLDFSLSPITAYFDAHFVSDLLFFFKSESAQSGPSNPQNVRIRELQIDSIRLEFSIKWKTGRVLKHPLNPLLFIGIQNVQTTIPSISQAAFEIPIQKVQHFNGDLSLLMTLLAESIKNSLIKQWFSILPGIEGTLRSVANGLRGTVTTGHRSAGVNRSLSETVSEGFHNLRDSIRDGLVGVIAKPLAESQKDGAIGLVKGIGSGLIGAIAKPVSGVLDVTASVVSCAKKFVERCDVIHPMRIPRVLVLRRIQPFDNELAVRQKMVQQIPELSMEQLVYSFRYQAGKRFAVITLNFLVLCEQGASILSVLAISKVVDVNVKGVTIRVCSGMGDGDVRLEVESSKKAVMVQKIINWRRAVANLTN